MEGSWPTQFKAVASLQLDPRNPRLGRESAERAPREIVQHLFEHDKAFEVAESIATRGYFPNEPLLAVKEDDRLVVVEGNRRLAALKALREPGLLDGRPMRQMEVLRRRMRSGPILKVPVTIAPSRRETDQQVAARHVGTPVLAWEAENRASFILSKLEEGYDNERLRDELGFTPSDIQKARQTRAIADMARSLDLPDEVRAKLEGPRSKVFTTLGRIFDSTVGRERLGVEPSDDDGIRGRTSKGHFLKVFGRLVSDVALKRASSRTLNNNEQIATYFDRLGPEFKVTRGGSFVPADVVQGKTVASPGKDARKPLPTKKVPGLSKTVMPKGIKIRYGNDRIQDIYSELRRLKREEFPNAGAVLLRVLFELTVIEYMTRSGDLAALVARLAKKNKRSRFGTPSLAELAPEITRIAKKRLSAREASAVEKAVRHDPAAPFSVSDLHSFVHSQLDLPGDRDIRTFWTRVEPLVRHMLEDGPEATST